MRKAQKQQAESFLGTLARAHDQLRKQIENKKNQASFDLARRILEDCQQGAIELGNMIESSEGNECAAVSLLEQYCELLYQIYKQMSESPGTVNPNGIHKRLHKLLIQIENSVKHDINVRSEVVFLPYKASMWDSLESVWKAAVEDKCCDVFVIPIPYYDKNPDGTFRQMHYEGEQYPDYVPVTWYEDYDFTNRHPDIIFIHNPYDNNNYVTSVYPYFYSSQLKEFTDLLVYIPYFILDEIEPEDKEAVNGMKHFVTTPGVINADRVIVQSEKMRQAYINVLIECMAGQGQVREYCEDKILGLGSPKVDKVLSVRKADLKIPQEWMKIICKPDGSWKKIIFYNTTVTALLQYNEQYLEKMRDVFRIFSEKRDKVVLLWRPHPLFLSTIQSMRPQLEVEYKKLVEDYREAGWGIYDDTSDIDRAVILSDGYYGDWSSVACLYQKAGKRIMVQNVHSLPQNNYSLAMDNIVEYKGEWWFLAMKENSIYKMKKDTLEATLVKHIPYKNNYMSEHPQYGKIHLYHNKIFVIPMLGDDIVVFDMEKDTFRYIKYGKSRLDRGTVFAEKIEYEDRLYLVPCGYDHIVCIEMETEQVRNIIIDDEERLEQNCVNAYAWASVYWDSKQIIFTKVTDNKVICMDFKSEKQTVYECNELDGGGSGICGDENRIWIIPKTAKKILCWDRHNKCLMTYDKFPQGYESGEWSFYKIQQGDELYLLPKDANMCIALNKENGTMRKLAMGNINRQSSNFFDRNMYFTHIWSSGDKIMLITSKEGKVFVFDDNGCVEQHIKIMPNTLGALQWPDRIYERQNSIYNIENYIDNSFVYEKGSDEKNLSGSIIFSRITGR